MESPQVAIPGAAHLGHHAGLLSHRNIHYRRFGHSRSSLTARLVWSPSIYQRVHLCANLLRFDLVNEVQHQRQKLETQSQELAELKAQNAEQRAQNATLAARLERLEAGAVRTATLTNH